MQKVGILFHIIIWDRQQMYPIARGSCQCVMGRDPAVRPIFQWPRSYHPGQNMYM